jgi:ribonuclease HI
MGNNNTVEIQSIAAHKGLLGSEKADELAKVGTTIEDFRRTPIPQSYIYLEQDQQKDQATQQQSLDSEQTCTYQHDNQRLQH